LRFIDILTLVRAPLLLLLDDGASSSPASSPAFENTDASFGFVLDDVSNEVEEDDVGAGVVVVDVDCEAEVEVEAIDDASENANGLASSRLSSVGVGYPNKYINPIKCMISSRINMISDYPFDSNFTGGSTGSLC
jgi:hypothetical protein